MASRQSDEWNSSHIGRLLECRRLSQAEFEVAKVWRGVYLEYLAAIGAPGYETPEAISDEECEKLSKRVERAVNDLKAKVGRRALHAVNSLVVYEEPEELGDFELTVEAAKVGLAHLARVGV